MRGKRAKEENRRRVRGPRISKDELEAALQFMDENPRGQRLRAAEQALVLLLKDQLPRLKQYVFNAAYDLREIIDSDTFQKTHVANSDLDLLIRQTAPGAYAKVGFGREQIHFALFYKEDLSENEAILYAQSFREVVALTFAALGLDMTGIVTVDSETLKKRVPR